MSSGAYADVFRPSGSPLVYKLFASGSHPTNLSQNLNRPEDETRRHKTFASECDAYELATGHSFLRNHVPRLFHKCQIADVQGLHGTVADRYVLDHCYAIEFIPGNAIKLGALPSGHRPPHIDEALRLFCAAGIFHLIDASIFFPEDEERFVFIDFATEEFQPSW